MIGVLEQFGWALLAVAAVGGVVWFADWASGYYQQPPDGPTLLDAPHAAEQARLTEAERLDRERAV